MTTEVMGKGKMEVEWLNVGEPEPIPPRKVRKLNNVKGLENTPDPEWEGKIPPIHRVAKYASSAPGHSLPRVQCFGLPPGPEFDHWAPPPWQE